MMLSIAASKFPVRVPVLVLSVLLVYNTALV